MENIKETEVYQSIQKEIEKIGAKSNENFEKLQNSYNEVQATLKSQNPDSEKLARLQEDMVTRQEAIDKANEAMNKRLDAFETALQRPGNGSDNVDEQLVQEAKSFFVSAAASQKRAMTIDEAAAYEPDVDAYNQYCKTFELIAMRKDEKLISEAERKALSVGIDPDGGYTVPTDMLNKIVQRIYESDPIRQLANVISTSTGEVEMLVDYNQSGAGWVNETQSRDETSTPKFDKKSIHVHELYAAPRITQKLLDDSGVNIEQWLSNHVGMRFARLEAAAFVNGDGIGKPRGFLTYSDYTTAGTDEYGKIEQIAMGHATQLTGDGFVKVKYALIEDYLNRGTWLMNRTAVRDAMLLKTGTGDYLWKPSIAVDSPSTILSLPVRMSTTMPAVAANALSVALADWNETYMIVDRLGISVQRDPYTVKPFIELYTRKRVGGDVVNYQSIKIGKVSA